MVVNGVYLNGRRYSQGSVVEYLPRVRESNVRVGSSRSFRIGIINMFYVFYRGDEQITFFSLSDLQIIEPYHSLYIIEKSRYEECRAYIENRDNSVNRNFSFVHNSSQHRVFHIDSITSKVHVVPHFNSEKRNDLMCAIRMWYAR